jgi:hypothetical protein
MTCKLHILVYWHPIKREWSCACGAVTETEAQRQASR